MELTDERSWNLGWSGWWTETKKKMAVKAWFKQKSMCTACFIIPINPYNIKINRYIEFRGKIMKTVTVQILMDLTICHVMMFHHILDALHSEYWTEAWLQEKPSASKESHLKSCIYKVSCTYGILKDELLDVTLILIYYLLTVLIEKISWKIVDMTVDCIQIDYFSIFFINLTR